MPAASLQKSCRPIPSLEQEKNRPIGQAAGPDEKGLYQLEPDQLTMLNFFTFAFYIFIKN